MAVAHHVSPCNILDQDISLQNDIDDVDAARPTCYFFKRNIRFRCACKLVGVVAMSQQLYPAKCIIHA
jgi:hypothetical protein